jgi:hypothetical protein
LTARSSIGWNMSATRSTAPDPAKGFSGFRYAQAPNRYLGHSFGRRPRLRGAGLGLFPAPECRPRMFALLRFFLALFSSLFKSKSRLEAENAALRRQVIVLQRKVRGRVHFTNSDRLFLIQLYRWFPSVLKVITIIRPETVVRWHRAGFRWYWRWKSRSLGGRPQIEADLRALIRRMSVDNPLWGAPRIHGELLKLGFEVAQSSIAKYMVKRHGPPSQPWRTFLRNHAPDIAAMDLFVAPTIGFNLLYGFIVVRLARRRLVWVAVTPLPSGLLARSARYSLGTRLHAI